MPSKTRDIEAAICGALLGRPLTVGEILDRFDGDDPRRVAVAMVHLRRDNVIRYLGCEPEHNHARECTVDRTP